MGKTIISVKDLQKKYNLSQTGVIKLMVFPDQAIKYVIDRMKDLGSIPKDPIAYIISQLKDYCKSNNLRPNWTIFYKLMEMNNLPLSSDNYLSKEDLAAVLKPTEKSVMYSNGMSVMRTLPDKNKNREVSPYVRNVQSDSPEDLKSEVRRSPFKLQSHLPYIHKKIELNEEIEKQKLENHKDKFISSLITFMSISEAENVYNNLQKKG